MKIERTKIQTSWPVKRLGDIAKTTYGYTASASHKSSGPKFLRITDIQDGGVNWNTVPSCNISKSNIRKYQLLDGDIVFARTGATTGKSYLVREPPESVFASYLIKVHIEDSNLLPAFLYLYFQTQSYWDRVGAGLTGSAQGGFNATKLSELSIPIPPLSEQKRIVAILDEAFAAIAKAKENAAKNLRNAKELFESYLRSLFQQPLTPASAQDNEHVDLKHKFELKNEPTKLSIGRTKKTGGRAATDRHIPGNLSLCVGAPKTMPKIGWKWAELAKLARMESGHTPSRRHPEYWGGNIPWIGITDAKIHHGRMIYKTAEYTNDLGINNSSARILPKHTVCLSRTASVGYVVVMGQPMATSQDFVNWVCSEKLLPEFLKYLLLAEARTGLHLFSSGAVHQTIYFPEAKAFYICYPSIREQEKIIKACDELRAESEKLEIIYRQKIAELEELKKSILQKAFSGELTAR